VSPVPSIIINDKPNLSLHVSAHRYDSVQRAQRRTSQSGILSYPDSLRIVPPPSSVFLIYSVAIARLDFGCQTNRGEDHAVAPALSLLKMESNDSGWAHGSGVARVTVRRPMRARRESCIVVVVVVLVVARNGAGCNCVF
jgi:hypothetical protein